MVVAELIVCPICGRDKHMKRTKMVYGHEVCRKCWSGFANRRQAAFVVDYLTIMVVDTVLMALVGFVAAFVTTTSGLAQLQTESEIVVREVSPMDLVFTLLSYGIVLSLYLFRDMMAGAGRSVGKALFGVRAMDINTGQPIGVAAAVKRSLPILIPLVPLIMAFQLGKGHRWGDGWSKSAVIWTKYADSIVFRSLFRSQPDPTRQDEILAQAAALDRPLEQNPYRPPTP